MTNLVNCVMGQSMVFIIKYYLNSTDITEKMYHLPYGIDFLSCVAISSLACQKYEIKQELLGECYCWWTSESPRAYLARFYGQFRLIRSVSRASKLSILKLIEIVILWVYYTNPFGLSFFRHFRVNIFNFWNHFVWRRTTDEGSLPEIRIWSILLIKSELKWWIHLSRSIFLYFYSNWPS